KEYGEIALEADRIVRACHIRPFQERCEELKKQLENMKTAQEAQKLAEDSSLSAGEDLLAHLFTTNTSVREKALEVYVRRVYRGHRVQDVRTLPSKESFPSSTRLLEASTTLWRFQLRESSGNETPWRVGCLIFSKGFDDLRSSISKYIANVATEANKRFKKAEELGFLSKSFKNVSYVILWMFGTNMCSANVLYIVLPTPQRIQKDTELERKIVEEVEGILKKRSSELQNARIHSVNLVIPNSPMNPRYFSFLEANAFSETKLFRDVPIPSLNDILERSKARRVLMDLLDELDRSVLDPRVTIAPSGRLYLHVIPALNSTVRDVVQKCEGLMMDLRVHFSERLLRLRVDQIELRVHVISPPSASSWNDAFPSSTPLLASLSSKDLLKSAPSTISTPTNTAPSTISTPTNTAPSTISTPTNTAPSTISTFNGKVIRLAATSEDGLWLHTKAFEELPDGITGEPLRYRSLRPGGRTIDSMQPYPLLDRVQEFQMLSSASSPSLLLKDEWKVGQNTLGMLGWLIEMKTPEYPSGRKIVLLANDITHQSGSFGVEEDQFYAKVSEYARLNGLPRIYISCNSGARIGLYEELKDKIHVAWESPTNPSLGFKYLYLTEATFASLASGTVEGEFVEEEGERRFKLKAIIGSPGQYIGVENLRGSGMIAGETSRSYDDTFTLSYVTGRSVGIGAYIVRLGQRVIQMQQSSLILTGYQALNKLLGKEVYASQGQLGGPQIMFQNGISHLVVQNDQEGVKEILRWLSYVPRTRFERIYSKGTSHSPLSTVNSLFMEASPTEMVPNSNSPSTFPNSPPPFLNSPPPFLNSPPPFPTPSLLGDPVDRPISFMPSSNLYNARHLFMGQTLPNGTWQSGFFDKASFKEYLAGWGKGVIVGRARLGGIPVGVIGVDVRSVEARIPADPANPDSREALVPQAGQVWFPDSAYKTAQAIEDFNKGENLPLFIFANWRGFSGGSRDMFGEVLKFGAMIVDALRKYKHPVFVYIPPYGELRGGAWVVVDPSINSQKMEMYADTLSRGGILEPPGICEIKFRKGDQQNLMHKLDPDLLYLDKQLENFQDDTVSIDLKKDIKKRETALMPLYLQIAHAYADLHDRAERMKAKGVIRDSVEWRTSRHFFYWRLKRRLIEDEIKERLRSINPTMCASSIDDMYRRLLPSTVNYEDDEAFVRLFEGNEGKQLTQQFFASLEKTEIQAQVYTLLSELPETERLAFLNTLTVT
ncbi:acetyl-CoA carboxylase ACC1, partial [Cardiosporidium cionae]